MSQYLSDDAAGDTAEPTVLFVDDEPELLDVYEVFCGPEYTTVTAAGSEEALAAFGPEVDLLFIDRRMPGMSGEAVVQTLRDEGYQTPVVFMSAVDPDAEPSVDYERYLTKPVDKAQIQAVITEYIP
jgi:CheY-like chemotaxis protein